MGCLQFDLIIVDIRLSSIIGVNPWEHEEEQVVVNPQIHRGFTIEKPYVSKLTLKIEKPSAIVVADSASITGTYDMAVFTNSAVSTELMRGVSSVSTIPEISGRHVDLDRPACGPAPAHLTREVFLALGSNIGDSAVNIAKAPGLSD